MSCTTTTLSPSVQQNLLKLLTTLYMLISIQYKRATCSSKKDPFMINSHIKNIHDRNLAADININYDVSFFIFFFTIETSSIEYYHQYMFFIKEIYEGSILMRSSHQFRQSSARRPHTPFTQNGNCDLRRKTSISIQM